MAFVSSTLRLAVALAMIVSARPVSAAPEEPARIAVLPLSVDGELPEDVRVELSTRLRTGLDGNDHEIVEGTDERCTTDNCWKAVAKKMRARHVVEARVIVRDRDYEITAELVDGRTGKVTASTQTRCEICGFTELGDSMDTVTNALQRKLAVAPVDPPMLVVRTRPAGATVLVDGDPVGTTPMSAPVAAGPHEIVVRKAGHIMQRRRVVSVDGVREAMTLQLARAPQDEEPQKRSRALGIAGWTAFAAGLAAVGAGVGLLVIHDDPIERDCDGQNVDIEGNCKYLHDTRTGGIAATVVGAALLGTGIALVVVDRKRAKATRTNLSVGPRGIRLTTRF